MFMGEFQHNIDAKGRLIIPSKIRVECGEKVVVTRGFEGCLALYTLVEWENYYQKLKAMPDTKKKVRDFIRIVTARANTLEFDKLGRINLPAVLRKECKLDKECIIIGSGDHVEIWNKAKWEGYYEENKDDFDEMLESLDEYL